MASGRGFERGIGLGLQAAESYSRKQEAEKDRKLRREMQGLELAERGKDRAEKGEDREAAMNQLVLRINAGVDSDDKKLQAAATNLGLTIGSNEDIAAMRDSLSRDSMDKNDEHFWANLGASKDQFKLLHDLNKAKLAEDTRRNIEMEEQGNTRLDDARTYQGAMTEQGWQRLMQQAQSDQSTQDLNEKRGNAIHNSMFGSFYQANKGLEALDGQSKAKMEAVRAKYESMINQSDTNQGAIDIAMKMEAELAKLEQERAAMLQEGRRQLQNRQDKVTDTPTKYSLKPKYRIDPDGNKVQDGTEIHGEGYNYQELLELQQKIDGGRTPIIPGISPYGDVPVAPDSDFNQYQEWQRRKREGK